MEKDLRDDFVFPFNITDEKTKEQKSINLFRIKAKCICKLRTRTQVQET